MLICLYVWVLDVTRQTSGRAQRVGELYLWGRRGWRPVGWGAWAGGRTHGELRTAAAGTPRTRQPGTGTSGLGDTKTVVAQSGVSYRRRFRSLLLCSCDFVFRVLVNSLPSLRHERSRPHSVSGYNNSLVRLTCKCILCSRPEDYVHFWGVCVWRGWGGGGEKEGSVLFCVHVYCKGMPEMEGIIICHWEHPFFFSPSIFRCWGCTLWWNLCTLHLLACQMSHRRRFIPLLRSFNAFWALIIISLCWFVAESCWAAEQIQLFGCFMFFVCFCFVFESRGCWQVKKYLITQFSLMKQKSLLFLTYLNTSFLVQNRRFRSHLV